MQAGTHAVDGEKPGIRGPRGVGQSVGIPFRTIEGQRCAFRLALRLNPDIEVADDCFLLVIRRRDRLVDPREAGAGEFAQGPGIAGLEVSLFASVCCEMDPPPGLFGYEFHCTTIFGELDGSERRAQRFVVFASRFGESGGKAQRVECGRLRAGSRVDHGELISARDGVPIPETI